MDKDFLNSVFSSARATAEDIFNNLESLFSDVGDSPSARLRKENDELKQVIKLLMDGSRELSWPATVADLRYLDSFDVVVKWADQSIKLTLKPIND